MPAGYSLVKAWRGMPPRLCEARAEPDVAAVVPLPCEAGSEAPAEAQQTTSLRHKPAKSFNMHIGGNLHIPTKNAQERPQLTQPHRQQQQQELVDPFEGLPFRGFAEKLGDAVLPAMQAARDAERQAKQQARKATEEAEVVMPLVPHVLPFTRWAATSTSFRSTFIADPPKQRKKARLSWYHPDDTMVPRDWFRGGLLADMKYYMPFGLGGGSATADAQAH